MPQPGDADVVAHRVLGDRGADGHDLADHLVSRHHLRPMHRQIALGDVQVGAAHPARAHLHQHLVVAGSGTGTRSNARGPERIGPGRCTRQAAIVSLILENYRCSKNSGAAPERVGRIG